MDTLRLSIVLIVYMAFCIISYYFIFRNHHKKNKVEYFELMQLFTNYFVTMSMSFIAIFAGIKCFDFAYQNMDDRSTMISYIVFGIAIISATIIYFIYYIKRNLKDFDPVERVNFKKRVMFIGELLELICFIALAFMPLYMIGEMKAEYLLGDKTALIKTILKSFAVSIVSIFLIFELNPMDVKGKIKSLGNSNKDK